MFTLCIVTELRVFLFSIFSIYSVYNSVYYWVSIIVIGSQKSGTELHNGMLSTERPSNEESQHCFHDFIQMLCVFSLTYVFVQLVHPVFPPSWVCRLNTLHTVLLLLEHHVAKNKVVR